MNKFVRDLVRNFEGASAGGHFKATGGYVLLKDADKFKEKLRNLT